MKARARIFLDIDGVVNLIDEFGVPSHANRTALLNVIKDNKIVRTEHVHWSSETSEFLRWVNSHGIEIWWLTGWKESARAYWDSLLDVHSSGWVPFDFLPSDFSDWSETGKKIGLRKFLEERERLPFAWVDDIATKTVNDGDFEEPHLAIATNPHEGLTGKTINEVTKFFQSVGI